MNSLLLRFPASPSFIIFVSFITSLTVQSFEQDASGISVDFVADDTDVMKKQGTSRKW